MPKLELNIIKLKFEGGLHLAKGKNVYDESDSLLHSDTLQSAIFACALQLYGKEKVNRNFLDSFRLSSAYPFFKDEFFFPKPFAPIQKFVDSVEEGQQPKKLKKIAFLGKSYFEDLINGGHNLLDPAHLLEGGAYVSDMLVHEKDQVIRSDIQQRVTIPSDFQGDSKTYYVDRLFFHQEAGLYFIINMHNEEMTPMIMGALRLLGDQGIGTDRSVGNGHFCHKEAKLILNTPDQPDRQLLLSLYCPEREEMTEKNLSQSSYQLNKRGGYLASAADVNNITLRKRSIFMFAEGSVFPIHASLNGKIENLKPEISTVNHPVWRDGRGFFIPMKSIKV